MYNRQVSHMDLDIITQIMRCKVMYDGKHQSSSIIHEYFRVSLIRLFIVQTPNYGWILSLKIWIQWTWSKLWGTIPNRYLIVDSRSCKCLGINRVETFFRERRKCECGDIFFEKVLAHESSMNGINSPINFNKVLAHERPINGINSTINPDIWPGRQEVASCLILSFALNFR